jgi:multidrug efflux pump
LGVTFFGLFLTPVFYVLMRTLAKRLASKKSVAVSVAPALEGNH